METQEKVSATLEKIGKVSKFSVPVEQGAQKLWSWFSNFGSVATTAFSVQYMWKQRLDNNCAVHKSRRLFKSVSCFAKLEATIIAHQEVNSSQMMQ